MARPLLDMDAARTTPPLLANALPRPRLLTALAQRAATARWLASPSGSGKSTVAAQYAQQACRRLLWYRLDERDDDPAFFHPTLARACRARLQVPAAALPPFVETDQHAGSDYARRFIDALSAALAAGQPALLVFDDAHRPRSPLLQQTLAAFALHAGPAIELLFVAEEPPPPPLFEAIAARRLAVSAGLDLRFDAAECAGVARSQHLAQVAPDTLAALTGGHAGALVIACELLRDAPTPARQAELASQLHAYLLERLVARLTAAQRELLLHASVLPAFTAAQAAALSQRTVDTDLEAAADRGLLIRHADGDRTVYEMHGLVRAGLRAIAAQSLGPAGLAARAQGAADLLEADGQLQSAFDTCIDFGLAARAADLLPALAEHLAQAQQPQSLLRAMGQVPAAVVARQPRVSLLAGHALLGVDEAQATGAFARAFADFEAHGDRVGMALAAASQLISFNLKCADLDAVGAWLERFHASKPAAAEAALTAPWRGVFLLGVLAEANQGEAAATTDAERAAALDELIALVTQPGAWLAADQQLAAATLTMLEAAVQRSHSLADRVATMTRPLADDAAISPLRRGRWWKTLGQLCCWENALDRAHACLAQLEHLAGDAAAGRLLRFDALELRLELSLRENDLDTADAQLAALATAAQLQVEVALSSLLAARIHLRRSRAAPALACTEAALAILRRAGVSRAYAREFEMEQAYALMANDRLPEAAALIGSVAAALTDSQAEYARGLAACVAFLAGASPDLSLLREGLACVRREAFPMMLWRVPAQVARLCVAALAADIETEFVHEVIRAQKLAPPADAGRRWPWPVRVAVLGGFELEIGGQPYRARKAQDRPLDLLKLLAVHNGALAGRVSRQHAAATLWPDADPANALKSLDMALARLRKLLGDEAAVPLADGRLSLSAQHVWCDLGELESALSVLRAAGTPAAAQRVLDLYRGHLLAGDEDAPWLLGARRTLWQAVRAAALQVGADPASIDSTGPLLERLLALEPTDEGSAQALMRWHLARRQPAQALRTYHELGRALGAAFGLAPSAGTERLRQQARMAAGAGLAADSP